MSSRDRRSNEAMTTPRSQQMISPQHRSPTGTICAQSVKSSTESKIAMIPRQRGQETQIKSPEEAVARTVYCRAVNIVQKATLKHASALLARNACLVIRQIYSKTHSGNAQFTVWHVIAIVKKTSASQLSELSKNKLSTHIDDVSQWRPQQSAVFLSSTPQNEPRCRKRRIKRKAAENVRKIVLVESRKIAILSVSQQIETRKFLAA
jgi:hypothetical protein